MKDLITEDLEILFNENLYKISSNWVNAENIIEEYDLLKLWILYKPEQKFKIDLMFFIKNNNLNEFVVITGDGALIGHCGIANNEYVFIGPLLPIIKVSIDSGDLNENILVKISKEYLYKTAVSNI